MDFFSGNVSACPANHQNCQTIGDERDFSKRVEYHGPQDEVGLLAGTLHSMFSRLQDAYQQVAQSLSKQRDFVADVSHELRTRLTTLRGNLRFIGPETCNPLDEQTDVIDDMVGESDSMVRLVNDLLRLAHADTGRSFSKDSGHCSMIEDCCRQVQKLDDPRKITWSCSNVRHGWRQRCIQAGINDIVG